jgi:dolichol-phosphate mannosyltransferase
VSDATVSIVVPAYEERDSLPILLDEIAALRDANERIIETIVVDDGSADGTDVVLNELAARFEWLRVIRFDRNRGQTAALAAGFEAARGGLVATLDADLQNDPADVPRLLEALEQANADMVTGVRQQRRDSSWKRLQSRVGNAVRNVITGDRVSDTGCALRIATGETLRGLLPFDGAHRFIPTLARARGAVVVELPVGHRARRFGASKYGAWNRALKGLVDCFRVRALRGRALR